MPNVNTGIAPNKYLLAAPDQWTTVEYLSRNNLIQLLLTQAVQRRQTTQRVANTLEIAASSSESAASVTIPTEKRFC